MFVFVSLNLYFFYIIYVLLKFIIFSIGDLDFYLLVALLQNSWIICNELFVLIFSFCNLSSIIHHVIQLTFKPAITFGNEHTESNHIYMKYYFQSFKLMT